MIDSLSREYPQEAGLHKAALTRKVNRLRRKFTRQMASRPRFEPLLSKHIGSISGH
ncbi:hypothetical protein [Achromobacter sp. Root565]|uniref:hypothetical protein n=1 Tax=Achromobacter sp. Root565 TaxID=1736564 RepID=UPI0012E37FB7|nr:hypothetical protein [Achromobacter sp. Root565]